MVFPSRQTIVDADEIINDVYDTILKVDLCSCQRFLVNSELEHARPKTFKQKTSTQH